MKTMIIYLKKIVTLEIYPLLQDFTNIHKANTKNIQTPRLITTNCVSNKVSSSMTHNTQWEVARRLFIPQFLY